MFRFGFKYAAFLWLGVPFVLLLFWLSDVARKRAMARLGDLRLITRAILSFSPARRRWKRFFFLLGYSFLVLAAMRPQLGTKLEKIKLEGIDIAIALDVSKSMLAEDLKPNRLANAKSAIRSFVERQGGNRLALVAFAGDAYIVCPLTVDYGAFLMFLSALDVGYVPDPGTDIASAIEVAAHSLEQDSQSYRAVILITDGEQTVPGDPVAAARRLAQKGIKVFTIGIGTPAGSPIPVRDQAGNVVGYKRDEDGAIVTSRLDEDLLAQIAQVSGGKYFPARPGKGEIRQILREIEAMGKKETEGVVVSRYDERYYYPLSLAILFLALSWFLPERRSPKGL